jgi:hypothetical protein
MDFGYNFGQDTEFPSLSFLLCKKQDLLHCSDCVLATQAWGHTTVLLFYCYMQIRRP